MRALLLFLSIFILEKQIAWLGIGFSERHGKLQNSNIGLKYKRKVNTKLIKVIKDKCVCDMVGQIGIGDRGVIYVEKRRTSYVFDCRQEEFQSSTKCMVRCPYRYRCDWFVKLVR